jgi:O-acetyl-ADP-ribose deacetylase (regulator of RNase III)
MRDRQPRQHERFWHVVTGDIGAIAISAGPWLAVVSSDDNYLLHGGGSSASIWQVAGPKLANAVSDQIVPPLDIGQVVETDAGDIPAKRVLHAITIDVDTGVRLDVDDARAMFDRLAQALIQLHRRSRDAPRRILVPLIGSGAGRLPFMMVTEALVSIFERLEPHGLSIVVCCDKPWVASRLETAIGQRYGKAFSAGDGSAREDWSQLVQELLRLLSRPPRSAPESGEGSQAHRWSDFIAESLGGEATEDRERKRAVQIAVHERNLLTHGLRDPGARVHRTDAHWRSGT